MEYIDTLLAAKANGTAVGAFNVFNEISVLAVSAAVCKTQCPAIIQTSVKTVNFFGARYLHDMVRLAAGCTEKKVFLHLDHCRDIKLAEECVKAGWDSVMYDGSALPLEENIRNTKKITDVAHGYGVAVEGELGRIMGVEDEIFVNRSESTKASLEESLYFVEKTGVDAFAPAIGTAHGVYKGKPHIDFALVEALSSLICQPVVIHGGTGLDREVFRRLIRSGGCKVNVSTALKNAYYDGMAEFLQKEPQEREPLKIDAYIMEKIEKAVLYHMSIFEEMETL